MSSRRVLKVAQAIREVVSLAILMDLKDPRVSDVTVTFVEVSGDLRLAKVHISVMGDEKKQNLCLRGLQSARGFLQKKIGNRIDTKYVPSLQFVIDKGVKNSMVVTRILDEVLPPKESETEEIDKLVEPQRPTTPMESSTATPTSEELAPPSEKLAPPSDERET